MGLSCYRVVVAVEAFTPLLWPGAQVAVTQELAAVTAVPVEKGFGRQVVVGRGVTAATAATAPGLALALRVRLATAAAAVAVKQAAYLALVVAASA